MTSDPTPSTDAVAALEAELAALKLAYEQLEAENAQLKAIIAQSEKDKTLQPDVATDEPESAASQLSNALGRIKSAVVSKTPAAFRRNDSSSPPIETAAVEPAAPAPTAEPVRRSSFLGYAVASIKGRLGLPGVAAANKSDTNDSATDAADSTTAGASDVARSTSDAADTTIVAADTATTSAHTATDAAEDATKSTKKSTEETVASSVDIAEPTLDADKSADNDQPATTSGASSQL
ncbi:hypothetical protein SPRG_02526 [Saprolegnia parasitica CBS 223.65]|uniref:Uncharacterized protein n=1 Tax=Saprolegnia parasitica (strain CBS 223.65) TaxID=695850 RepID=A0A067CQQ7_SAPPC|nr:hypothetical protein SPRG_02526 [Saprolegnia parasitica CBS 223.65]KDO32833.1 hypothetical protein SPRG_02526 [Saprolegnia parasitica CBS 223.65]|eukprot:XP_012196488.1 hypothetical protein SPRG_02526 [Saprolegnia parasitica CBS 223.65]